MTSQEQTSQPRAAFCTQMMLISAQLYENPPKYSLHKQKSEVCKLYPKLRQLKWVASTP